MVDSLSGQESAIVPRRPALEALVPVFFSYGRGEHQRLCVGRVVQDDATWRTILLAAAPAMLPDAGSQQRLFAGSVEFTPVAMERAAAFSSMSEAQDAFGHLPYPVQTLVDEFVQRGAMSAYRAAVDGRFVSAASSGEHLKRHTLNYLPNLK